ncbi:MAG: hypothetical protein VX278_19300, partial [Myxococcota bacterium]|nr:hypothetical protein [Myxococcota bacterium]
LKGKSDLEREEIRKEAAEKIQEKREELNERTEEFDRVRAKATQITIAIISVVASIAVGIASAGIGTVAGGLLINTLLVAGKAVIVEGARKYLQGDEVALREAVARIAAATIIEHLGAHIGAFTSELTALTEESIEANSGLDQFFSDKLNTEIQAGPLSKVITQYPVATGLAAAAGSSVGATAAVIAQNEGGLKAGLRDLKDTLIDEVKNFHKTFFVELTKTLVTDSDNVNQDNFATFAVHDAVASEIVAPAFNQSQARYTRIDAIRKKLHTDIDTIEVDLSSLEQNLTTLTSMRASVSFIRKKLEKNLVDLETNFKSYYKASDGRKDCKEKIKVLYRDQKKFQDMFMKFKQERDEFRAQKDRFFESISSTEKEIQDAAVVPELANVIQLKLSDAQAKTNIFGKIERWISNTEPFLTDASQRIATQRERYYKRG